MPLAALADPDLVAPTIAAALGALEERDRPILESLQAYLAPRQSCCRSTTSSASWTLRGPLATCWRHAPAWTC